MNGNKRWKEAVAKEVAALLNLQCFDIQSLDFKPDNKYQYVHIHWVYAVKYVMDCVLTQKDSTQGLQ